MVQNTASFRTWRGWCSSSANRSHIWVLCIKRLKVAKLCAMNGRC